MLEASGGSQPPTNSNAADNVGRRNKSQSHSKKSMRENRFKGECTELKGYMYDVVASKDTFQHTTQKIAEYVTRTLDDAGEFHTSMVELELPDLVQPAQPANATNVFEVEIWKMEGDQQDWPNKNSEMYSPLV